MEQRVDVENGDEVMMPGFRFHPTDEELVGYYLKRKIQQKPLSIELIRQLDIYKYDPWDLPKLASTGEKEWYFYCPRDRKYRNSARPNRVTGAGFWKATGTDRPIYSTEGTICIGLKKSLVFYRGRAAKGTKTDWMMHEFRLPSLSDASIPKKPLDKNIPLNESWAICRIFKKTNSTAYRAISNSWVSPTTESDFVSVAQTINANQFVSGASTSSIQFQQSCPPQDLDMSFKSTAGFGFSQEEMPAESLLLSLSSETVEFSQQPHRWCDELFTLDLPLDSDTNIDTSIVNDNQWGNIKTSNFPFCLAPDISQEWNVNSPWEYSSLYPSEISTNFATNICYS